MATHSKQPKRSCQSNTKYSRTRNDAFLNKYSRTHTDAFSKDASKDLSKDAKKPSKINKTYGKTSKEDKHKPYCALSHKGSGIDGYSEKHALGDHHKFRDFEEMDKRHKNFNKSKAESLKPFRPVDSYPKTPPVNRKTTIVQTKPKPKHPPKQYPQEFDYGNIDLASIEASATVDSDISYADAQYKTKIESLKCLHVPTISVQTATGRTLDFEPRQSRKGRLKEKFDSSLCLCSPSEDKAVQTDIFYGEDFAEPYIRSRSVSARREDDTERERRRNDERDNKTVAERRSRSMGARKGAVYLSVYIDYFEVLMI